MEPKDAKSLIVKNIYFYLVSFAALMMIVISSVAIVETLLKMTLLSEADRWSNSFYVEGCDGMPRSYAGDMMAPMQPAPTPEFCAREKARQKQEQDLQIIRNQQRELAWSLPLLAVALPLFMIHWKLARKKD